MEAVNKIRLINRGLIKEGIFGDRLYNFNKIVEISERYDIAVRIGTDGGIQPGPYLESMYIKSGKTINIQNLIKYLNEISGFMDLYSNSKPYVYIEMALSYVLEQDGKLMNGQTQLIMWKDNNSNKPTIKAVGYKEEPVTKLSTKIQERYNSSDIILTKEESAIFSPNEEKVSNAIPE